MCESARTPARRDCGRGLLRLAPQHGRKKIGGVQRPARCTAARPLGPGKEAGKRRIWPPFFAPRLLGSCYEAPVWLAENRSASEGRRRSRRSGFRKRRRAAACSGRRTPRPGGCIHGARKGVCPAWTERRRGPVPRRGVGGPSLLFFVGK